MNKAVFLDKDGTLVVDIPYNVDPLKIKLSDHILSGLLKLQQQGYLLIVISNQSGIALGYFTEEELNSANQKLIDLLSSHSINLLDIYYCPHHPEGVVSDYAIQCKCRKPRPGLLRKAASDYKIDLSKSWMIGDILNDIEAGKRAGCQTILLMNGNETEWEMSSWRHPDYYASTIDEAAEFILSSKEQISKNVLADV